MYTVKQAYPELIVSSAKSMVITSSFNDMKKKQKKIKALAVVKAGRPKKNKRGQILNKKTGKFLTGRPEKIDKAKLQKLEIAFGYGCTDEESCAFAKISPSTLYNYQQENPKFMEEKEGLKQMPNLKARKVVVKSMEKDPSIGQWWLEKKLPGEFGKGAGGTTIAVQINNKISEKKKDYGI